jgi:hypothetical protein
MERAAGYFFFAERWGWDSDRVDQLPVWLHDRLPTIAALHDQVLEERRKADSGA